jgi:hypothetical protein
MVSGDKASVQWFECTRSVITVLSAVQLIFFKSIKVVQEYDYTIGVCLYGCTSVRVYRCTGVRVYWCMGLLDTFQMHHDNLL